VLRAEKLLLPWKYPILCKILSFGVQKDGFGNIDIGVWYGGMALYHVGVGAKDRDFTTSCLYIFRCLTYL